MEQKLKWAFSIYDVNGDGNITKQEMFRIVDALYKTMGDNPGENDGIPSWDELTPEERTLKVFQSFDTNRDGVLSLSEFIEGAKKDKTLALILQQGAEKTWVMSDKLKKHVRKNKFYHNFPLNICA